MLPDEAPSGPGDATEPGAVQQEVAALRRTLDETVQDRERDRAWVRRRRSRYEVEFERERSAARTGAIELKRANALLDRPIVRLAVRLQARIDAVRSRVGNRVRWLRAERPVATNEAAGGGAPRVSGTAGGKRRIAIHIVPETWEVAARWGDTQFARDLAAAFERMGWAASVHVRSEFNAPAARRADVALFLFGLGVPMPREGQLSIVWVISHPDRFTARTAERFAAVFVASEAFAVELAPRVDRPVRFLPQATEPVRFHPDPTGPHHELLFVGNSRGVRRPIVDALAGTARDLAVYGGGWREDLIEPGRVRGEWIPTDELRRYYSSADIVLSDHWEDMRDEGFVANRVFDALACGAFVLSDSVAGMDALFDDAVATYDDVAELPALVERFLADDEGRRERAERGRRAVLDRHTFDHRAATIATEIARLLVDRPA